MIFMNRPRVLFVIGGVISFVKLYCDIEVRAVSTALFIDGRCLLSGNLWFLNAGHAVGFDRCREIQFHDAI